MLGDRCLESLLRPIGAAAIHALIHAFIKGTFCFAYAMFATLDARDKVDEIRRFAVCLPVDEIRRFAVCLLSEFHCRSCG